MTDEQAKRSEVFMQQAVNALMANAGKDIILVFSDPKGIFTFSNLQDTSHQRGVLESAVDVIRHGNLAGLLSNIEQNREELEKMVRATKDRKTGGAN